jgi:hypothetical protein
MKIQEAQLCEVVCECVKKALSEIGDTRKGARKLGAVAGRSANRVNNSKTPEERLKHAKVVRDALNTFDKASVKNGERDSRLSNAFTKGMKSGGKLNEVQLRRIVAESVERVLNEISYELAKSAFKKAGENFDKDWSLYKNPRKVDQLNNLYQHFVDRSAENFNPDMPVLVCFDDHCENFKAGDLEQYFEVTGFVEPSPNSIYADQKMISYPKLKGFIGPM